MSMRRKLLLSHLATAAVVAAAVRVIVGYVLEPQLRALPGGFVQARQMLNDFGLVLLVVGLVTATLGFWLFEKLVLGRYARLGRQIRQVADAPDRSQRVHSGGGQELSVLAAPVNSLLGSLEATQAALAAQQHQLSISQQRLSLALEATGDGLWDYRRGERTYFSDSYYQMLGYPISGDELQPDHWLKLVHPDDLASVQAAIHAVHVGSTDRLGTEYRIKNAAGQWKWVYLRGRVIERGVDRLPLRMIGTVQDIDARRQGESSMRENQELFRNAFQESAVGMAMVRPDGTFIRVNPPLCQILGYGEEELLTVRFQDITHPDDVAEDVALLEALLRGERSHYSMEKRYVRRDGSQVWAQLNVGVALDDAQKPLYLISQVQDITQRKFNEDELQAHAQRLFYIKEELERSTAELAQKTAEAEAAKAAAEQANRTKSAFLANMSHEIRTPMAAIIGFAKLLQDHRLPEDERARCIETVGRNGQHLLALINDILDLSKIEAGKMTVECIACDPAQVMADVEATTAAKAADKNLPLSVRISPDVPRRVRTDPTRLRQVLLNLVSNAIKFTQAGEIRVDVGWAAGDDGEGCLRVGVADTGIGMTPDQLGRLFEPFSQADISTTRRFGGTGLGLAICRRLVEMMEGEITVQSVLGRGTKFEMTIRAPRCHETAVGTAGTDAAAPNLRPGLRVLLAEDGPDNQRLISFYLRHSGIEAAVADNGRAAADRVLEAARAGCPFDLVLMDMQMPEMDGYEATRLLRAAGQTLPILALTAHGMEEARQQSLDAGCVDHLVKPVEHEELIRAIATHTAVADAATGRISSIYTADPNYRALIDAYVTELPGQVARLLDLAERRDDGPLRRLLHQIKGAGGGYGLDVLSTAAATAESAFAESDVNRLTGRVDDLIRLMRSVQGYDRSLEFAHGAARLDH